MPFKLSSNQLPHIDNNFYHLTAWQAKQLSAEDRLPRHGYSMESTPGKLAKYEFGKVEGAAGEDGRWRPFNLKPVRGRVLRTNLSWFNGAPVKLGWVWAIHLY